MNATQLSVHVRWAIRSDLPEICAIENEVFEFPWCEEDFMKLLRLRNGIGMIAEVDNKVVGFMMYMLHKGHLIIENFGVSKAYQRQGVGTAMFSKLINKLSFARRKRILLTVRESNLPAQMFFRAMGCKAVGVLREYYDHTSEDGYSFEFNHRGDHD